MVNTNAPTLAHWQAVKRILCYLGGTTDHGLLFRKPTDLSLQGIANADSASDPNDHKSTSG